MIFLTIGTHEPFDRLVRCVDEWCAEYGYREQIFGQITEHAKYHPKNFEAVASLEPREYDRRFSEADLIVSHAGMGSIITALVKRKPIVIMPRRGHLNETRNDHQFDTVQRFRSRPGVLAAQDEAELWNILDQVVGENLVPEQAILPFADDQLIGAVQDFIDGSFEKK